jgi:hypothetical protein
VHWDTLCFRNGLILLHLHLRNWDAAEVEAGQQRVLLERWPSPRLANNSFSPLLFRDFHDAIATYANVQRELEGLGVQLSSFPNVPYRNCVRATLVCLQLLQPTRCLEAAWGLQLAHTSGSLATLARELMALDVIGYAHPTRAGAKLLRSAAWEAHEFPTALSILALVPDAERTLPFPSLQRVLDANITGFLQDVNRAVYHARPHPHFAPLFEETIVARYI